MEGGRSLRGPWSELLPKGDALLFPGIEFDRKEHRRDGDVRGTGARGVGANLCSPVKVALGAGVGREVVPDKRTSSNPSASRDPKATPELW